MVSERLNDEEDWSIVAIQIPPELKDYGPELQRFWDAQIYKLRRNANKGKWEDVPLDQAVRLFENEVQEMHAAIFHGSTSEILMECADVANMALIVANIGLEVRDA